MATPLTQWQPLAPSSAWQSERIDISTTSELTQRLTPLLGSLIVAFLKVVYLEAWLKQNFGRAFWEYCLFGTSVDLIFDASAISVGTYLLGPRQVGLQLHHIH